MSKTLFSLAAFVATLSGSLNAAETGFIGTVNFANCITESKAGIQEQQNMENLRKQMSSMIESAETELRELNAKFDDTEYLDSLSPKAEEELKMKHQALQEDLGRYQQQFYQVLNHANYQMVQKMRSTIESAAATVAKSKNLDYVINEEACFYIRPDLDVTDLVVNEMNQTFDLEAGGAKKISDGTDALDRAETTQQAG